MKPSGAFGAPVRLLGYPSQIIITQELIDLYESKGWPIPELPLLYPKANTPPSVLSAPKEDKVSEVEKLTAKIIEEYPDYNSKQLKYLLRSLDTLRRYSKAGNQIQYKRLCKRLLFSA